MSQKLSDSLIESVVGTKSLIRKRRETSLDWLCSHKNPRTGEPYLNTNEALVAEKLLQDYLGSAGKFITQIWSEHIDTTYKPNNLVPSHHYIQLRARLEGAMNVLAEMRYPVMDICLKGEKLTTVEKKYKLSRGSAKHILKEGLNRLIDYYGYRAGRG